MPSEVTVRDARRARALLLQLVEDAHDYVNRSAHTNEAPVAAPLLSDQDELRDVDVSGSDERTADEGTVAVLRRVADAVTVFLIRSHSFENESDAQAYMVEIRSLIGSA